MAKKSTSKPAAKKRAAAKPPPVTVQAPASSDAARKLDEILLPPVRLPTAPQGIASLAEPLRAAADADVPPGIDPADVKRRERSGLRRDQAIAAAVGQHEHDQRLAAKA